MCGIVAILNVKEQTHELREKALKMSQKIRHRGPDWSGIYCGGSAILAHERLSIVDPESGGQPLFSPDRKQVLAVNGEIYNHQEIRRRFAGQYEFQTGSDCEVILALYRKKGIDFLEDLSGIFAFVLYDEERNEFLIARDPIGVIPLYIGYDSDGTVYVASELKALEGQCEHYEPFLPGHYYWSASPGMKWYYRRDWMQYEAVQNNAASVSSIHDALEAAVADAKKLVSDEYEYDENDDWDIFQNQITALNAARLAYLTSSEPDENGAWDFTGFINYPWFCNPEYEPSWDAENKAWIPNQAALDLGWSEKDDVNGTAADIANMVNLGTNTNVVGEWYRVNTGLEVYWNDNLTCVKKWDMPHTDDDVREVAQKVVGIQEVGFIDVNIPQKESNGLQRQINLTRHQIEVVDVARQPKVSVR